MSVLMRRHFWEEEEFRSLLPYLKGVERRRLDLLSTAPPWVQSQALSFMALCCECGRPMHPFRERRGEGGIYINVSCPTEVNPRCHKGRKAAAAKAFVWTEMERYWESGPQQGRLFGQGDLL